MAIANCARCARMYQKAPGIKLCPICIREEEAAFQTVRDYLYDHPGADIVTVSADTGVDQAVIVRFIKAGRLSTLEEVTNNLSIDCKRCGRKIGAGTYCGPCIEAMSSALKNSARELGGP